MKTNVGTTDKIIRIVLAGVLLILILTSTITGVGMWIAIIAIIILAVTSAKGYCGLYSILGINTCPITTTKNDTPKEKKKKKKK